jgi:hypothetical protein
MNHMADYVPTATEQNGRAPNPKHRNKNCRHISLLCIPTANEFGSENIGSTVQRAASGSRKAGATIRGENVGPLTVRAASWGIRGTGQL